MEEQTEAIEPQEGTVDDEGVQTVDAPDDEVDQTDLIEEETFPRDYVEKLRQENGKYRQRAQQADDLARRLHIELVRATGRLADPTDLPYDDGHLEDPDALALAVEELLSAKPHLASRRPTGQIGQGATSSSAAVDLAGLLRARAV